MTNTQSKPSQIPQYFIFRNDGTGVFTECLRWFNKKYGVDYNLAGFWEWYGYHGFGALGSSDASDSPEYFQNNPTRFEPAELWALIQKESAEQEEAQHEEQLIKTLRDIGEDAKDYACAMIKSGGYDQEMIPKMAYDLADAMLAERKKRGV